MRSILLSSALLFGLVAHASADVCLEPTDMAPILNTSLDSKEVNARLTDAIRKATGIHIVGAIPNPNFFQPKDLTLHEKPSHDKKSVSCIYKFHETHILTYVIPERGIS